MRGKLIKHGHSYALVLDEKLVAFAHPEDFRSGVEIGKLSIKNCQAIECGYDLDELANKYVVDDMNDDIYFSFIAGFQKALEILGDKKFSEKELTMFFAYGHQIGMNNILAIQSQHSPQPIPKPDSDKLRHELIQSLQQTEWDVEIVEQCLDPTCDGVNRKGECITTGKPKLDADGCLILKRVV